MKKLIFALTLGTFCFFGTNAATFAQQHGAQEDFVKSLTESFNESDYFTTVDDEDGFEKRIVFGAYPRVYRWYYRPIVRPVRYAWRPVYYRPVYTYYRYWAVPYRCHFSWTTVTTSTTFYKSAGDTNGAMLDSDPAPNSPLARQGLRKGDIITHVDGQPLRSLQDLNRATANSRLTVQKGDQTRFAGNLLKSADENLMKGFEGLQEVEAGTLMTNAQISEGNFDMYKYFERNADRVVFGVKAIENNGNGVKVTEVVAGMPGQKSGFEVNDVILEINGTKITSERDYSDAIDRAGKVARMVVLCGRTGQTVNADVVLNK